MSTRPTKPTPPTQALRSDPRTFDQRAEASMAYQFNALPTWMEGLATYMESQANASAAGYRPASLTTVAPNGTYYPVVRSQDKNTVHASQFGIGMNADMVFDTDEAANGDVLIRDGASWLAKSLAEMMAARSTSIVPVGLVSIFGGATAPQGWLLCDGSSFNPTTLPKLADVLGRTTTPDLRGEFVRGLDKGRGVDAGRERLTHQDATEIFDSWGVTNIAYPRDSTGIVNHDGGVATRTMVVGTAGANGAQTIPRQFKRVRPRNVAMNYIIKHD